MNTHIVEMKIQLVYKFCILCLSLEFGVIRLCIGRVLDSIPFNATNSFMCRIKQRDKNVYDVAIHYEYEALHRFSMTNTDII